MNDIERAELMQSLKAYLIPSSLFVACLIGAAGTFLIREGYQLGWAFIGTTALIIIWAMWAFICFQNKHRFEGRFVDEDKARISRKTSNKDSAEDSELTNFAPDAEVASSAENMSPAESLTGIDK